MSGQTSLPYTFHDLLKPLEGTREAEKLALMSAQVKIERELLAEIMYRANTSTPKEFEFILEEDRRDLVVREWRDSKPGKLVEWVEAKMCYTDCLARSLTGHLKVREYAELLLADAKKQEEDVRKRLPEDRTARLTSLLFAIHREHPVCGQKYYPEFKNRGQHQAAEIERAASEHVRGIIARYINRDVVEEFTVQLVEDCRLLVFVLRGSASSRS